MKLIFKEKEQEIGDIYSFTFIPLEEIKWTAGQTIGLELETEYVTEERHFTISSAPYEKDIIITTQVSNSDFKQALYKLKSGDEIDAFAIGGGDFIWEDTPLIFIAGGMGITPYFSILKQLNHEERQPESIDLFYSTKKHRLLFEKQLNLLEKKINNLNIHYEVDNRVSTEFIKQKIIDIEKKLIYISGPPKMVDELSEEFIIKLNIPEENLKRDWFTGL